MPQAGHLRVGGVFVAAPHREGDAAFAAAVALVDGRVVESAVVEGTLGSPYVPGLLALREGRLLAEAVSNLRQRPDVLLVNASGRDHPRKAGLALHIGAALDLPTIGVTDRPLLAQGPDAAAERGATAPLLLAGEVVGYRLRTQPSVRPVIVHIAWRVDAETTCAVVLCVSHAGRTPGPLREARRLARTTRSASESRPRPA
jgi:deoxyribonuclease V